MIGSLLPNRVSWAIRVVALLHQHTIVSKLDVPSNRSIHFFSERNEKLLDLLSSTEEVASLKKEHATTVNVKQFFGFP